MLLWGEVLHGNPNNGCKGDQFCLGDVTLCLGSEHAALQYSQNLTITLMPIVIKDKLLLEGCNLYC